MTDIETEMEELWQPEQCLCAAAVCRKQITGDDWRLRDLHKRYEGYFSTHVTNAINAKREMLH